MENQSPSYDSLDRYGKSKQTNNGLFAATPTVTSSYDDDKESLKIIMNLPTQEGSNFPPVIREPVTPRDEPGWGYETPEGFILFGPEAPNA